jgi:hypothetical protein
VVEALENANADSVGIPQNPSESQDMGRPSSCHSQDVPGDLRFNSFLDPERAASPDSAQTIATRPKPGMREQEAATMLETLD